MTDSTTVLMAGKTVSSHAPWAITSGIDLTQFTFSGSAFKSPGYNVDGSGNITGLYNTATSGNVFKINGNTITGVTGNGANVVMQNSPTFTGTVTIPDFNSQTGSGAVVLQTNATLITPLLGTPQSGVMTNVTGLPLATGVTGTLAGANGGTGLNTAAIGDLIYASAATPTWSRLADVATGSVLVSGGVNTAPVWATNFSAGTITASLTGHASLDCALTGCAMSGAISGVTNLTASGTIAANGSNALIVAEGTFASMQIGDVTNVSTTPTMNFIKSASGGANLLQGFTVVTGAAKLRWQFQLGDGTAESGTNAGSNFTLAGYSDAGSFLGSWLNISRSNGNAAFAGDLSAVTYHANGSAGVSCSGINAGTLASINGIITHC